jgi:hypothetical protein
MLGGRQWIAPDAVRKVGQEIRRTGQLVHGLGRMLRASITKASEAPNNPDPSKRQRRAASRE